MKKLGGLTSLDVKKARHKKWGRREQFVTIVVLNSLQKWVGFNMWGVADVKSWKICLKASSKREGPQEKKRFWKGVGRGDFDVEPVEVRSRNGGGAKVCGSFLYLWSLTDNKGSSGPEMRRRIKKASETFRRLWQVWAMKYLPLKLKGRLYLAFVPSVLV